jgi:DNA-binding NarL/FixJ family response regulator
MTAPLRLLIVDDEALLRAGLRALLAQSQDVVVVGEARDGRDVLEQVSSLKPQVVLMDLFMREVGGFDALIRLTTEAPDIRVLVVSGQAEVRHVARAMVLGAAGYLQKSASAEELIQAIRQVSNGMRYLGSGVPIREVEQLEQKLRVTGDGLPVITERQREVLRLVALGKSSKEIAAEFGLSVKTVEVHRSQLMARLGVRDVAGLVHYAIAEGLIIPPR